MGLCAPWSDIFCGYNNNPKESEKDPPNISCILRNKPKVDASSPVNANEYLLQSLKDTEMRGIFVFLNLIMIDHFICRR